MTTNPRDNGCLCQVCGRRYRIDLQLPDDLWQEIQRGVNLICGPCIMRRLESLGQFDAFELVRV